MKLRFLISGLIIACITGLAIPDQIAAQNYSISDESKMTIFGSANVTDWEAEVKTIEGEIILQNDEEIDWSQADASWFERVNITMPVSDIGGDSDKMNRNIHKYLEIDDHPNITYVMDESRNLAISNPGAELTAVGIITAAGASHEMEHKVNVSVNSAGQIVVSGSQELLMTDFEIDPPTAMLGAIRSHDEITIQFELILEKK